MSRRRKLTARLAKQDREDLRAVLAYCRFKNASFGQIGPRDSNDKLPTSEHEVTAFIKRRTRIYFETWVIPVLEEMIARGQPAKIWDRNGNPVRITVPDDEPEPAPKTRNKRIAALEIEGK